MYTNRSQIRPYSAPSGSFEKRTYPNIPELMSNLRALPEYGAILNKYDFGINFMQEKPTLIIGNLYSLSGSKCEDFTMPEKVYQLIAILHEVHGVDLQSVIVKQVDGEENTIFSLTKFDCETLSIPFEKGLQIFPKDMAWKEYQDKNQRQESIIKKADLNDLSTYPKSPIDGTIRNILLKVNNFYCVSDNYFEIPNGAIIDVNELYKSLIVITKENIPLKERSKVFHKGEVIPYVIVVDRDEQSSKKELFIELNLSAKCVYSKRTADDLTGVMPDTLIGKTTDDLFDIYIQTDKKKINNTQDLFASCPKIYFPDWKKYGWESSTESVISIPF